MELNQILLGRSNRGMHALWQALPNANYLNCAKNLLSKPCGTVLLTTGFWAQTGPETDGPPGTWFIAKGLAKLGYTPVIITDTLTAPLFSQSTYKVIAYPNFSPAQAKQLLAKLSPVALIACERCGRTAYGLYLSMTGADISAYTPALDELFLHSTDILSIGIGDGGNEIGMGKLAPLIANKLNCPVCQVSTDYLLPAATSNRGAYGLIACLQKLTGIALLPTANQVSTLLNQMVNNGAVDGITHKPEPTVDGYALNQELQTLNQLHRWANKTKS